MSCSSLTCDSEEMMPSSPPQDSEQGFTLIEVSIVLVIIGLVIGSVIAGKHLVRQSELQSVLTDVNRIRTAANAFYGKYDALPGDMPNATDYWGQVSSTPSTCYTTQGTGTQTCNGNGNGEVYTMDGGTTISEVFRFWQHLSNAKMIDGTYTGISGAGDNYRYVAGVNVYRAKYGSISYYFWGLAYGPSVSWYSVPPQHAIKAMLPDSSGYARPAFTPSEMLDMDSKVDDGKPAYGSIFTYKSSLDPTVGGGCSTSDTESAAVYNTSNKTVTCIMLVNSNILY